MSTLEKAKEVIATHIMKADCGIFNTRNLVGDEMTNLYSDGEVSIDICYHWNYFEVFGLTAGEFLALVVFYEDLLRTVEGV